MGREWGIGSKNNDGVLLLLSVEERQIVIEVGYGLEGALPDGKTGRILDNYAMPYLKSDDFSTGLREAFSALIGETATEYGVEINGSSLAPDEDEDEYKSSKAVIIDFIIFIIIVFAIRKITGRTPFIFFGGGGNHHSGGGFSGGGFSGGSSGGFSGGGGSFGGGGSSRGF